MMCVAPVPLVLTLALAGPAPAGTKIKIDTVPPEYTPTAGPSFQNLSR